MDVCAQLGVPFVENWNHSDATDPEQQKTFVIRRLTPDTLHLEIRNEDATLGCLLETFLPDGGKTVLFAVHMQPQPQERRVLIHIRFSCPQSLAGMQQIILAAIIRAKHYYLNLQNGYADALSELEQNETDKDGSSKMLVDFYSSSFLSRIPILYPHSHSRQNSCIVLVMNSPAHTPSSIV